MKETTLQNQRRINGRNGNNGVQHVRVSDVAKQCGEAEYNFKERIF